LTPFLPLTPFFPATPAAFQVIRCCPLAHLVVFDDTWSMSPVLSLTQAFSTAVVSPAAKADAPKATEPVVSARPVMPTTSRLRFFTGSPYPRPHGAAVESCVRHSPVVGKVDVKSFVDSGLVHVS
jgi:hypothetical protein